jgi:hypothetical protein
MDQIGLVSEIQSVVAKMEPIVAPLSAATT